MKRRRNPTPIFIVGVLTKKDALRVGKHVEKQGYEVVIEHDPSYSNSTWDLYHEPIPGYESSKWSNARQIAREYMKRYRIFGQF